ncbi:MAG: 4-(cytidine 5'-diphospho)-2-C-methyl-D-erythritol kinase, partial [Alphaproteobacteria bacterium]|nr:4-(cytidine 5'-diphospho)-2-C-methyl-D-erythritol kinase [Alphaproteobacteria bacterium]
MYIEQAAAKINLTLQIIGKLPNGMHRLESLVVFAALTDRLQAMPIDESQNGITLALHGPYGAQLENILANANDNLIIQAAYALREAAQISCGAALQLQKNIPIMSGLGGGSADAAAALRLLNRFWQLDWPVEKLMPLAVQLGADVPVCLLNQTAWMSGYGEQVQIISPPESSLSPLPSP